jgi:hypothetical protein
MQHKRLGGGLGPEVVPAPENGPPQAHSTTPAEGTPARDPRETEADVSQTRKRYRREVEAANAELYEEPKAKSLSPGARR